MPTISSNTVRSSVFAKYQPIINLTTNRIVGCEALARWRADDGCETSIEPVIDELESQEDLALELTTCMFTCLKADLGTLLVEHPTFSVSVNLPPIVMGKNKILPVLEKLGLIAHLPQLTGEITERQALNEQGRDAIRLARQLGARVAIDDFGTGQSGLQQLIGLEVDTIKIDQSFIRQLGTNIAAERLVRGIAALATILKVDIVAEGVETAEQASFLRAIGIEKGQGWFWAKALTPTELREWLS
ncbi:MAG: EAL domain-containing protein [Nitrospirales bacterium]|nr:EAL domain-containing protein [Nitrospirales bacterium]MDR4484409.1 EAL domain-containing protein [Nitrospirales bacterium]